MHEEPYADKCVKYMWIKRPKEDLRLDGKMM